MQRLILNRKRIIVVLLLLSLTIISLMTAVAQDSEVDGELFVATNADGQLLVFGMDGDTPVTLAEETFDTTWHGWRLEDQEILLYTPDLSDDIESHFAVVNADGLQFVEMDDVLQTTFTGPYFINYASPYVVIVEEMPSEYSPALLINLDTATADLLSMDYAVASQFRLSEDGEILRYAEHGEAVTDQNIVEYDLESGEKTVVNTASASGRLYPNRTGETWVEIRPTPISPLVNLYHIDGEVEAIASGTQEEWYWVAGSYLINNTSSCDAGNCLHEFRSLRDGSTVQINAPEGIGFWRALSLDDGRFIVPDDSTQAYWLLSLLGGPTQLGFSTTETGSGGAIVRLSPNEQWLVVESAPTPGDPNLSIRVMDVDTTAIAATTQGDGSIHGIWFGDDGILIEMVTSAVLFNQNDSSMRPVPTSDMIQFHAVLSDNTVLYTVTDATNDMEAGIYQYDADAETSTLLFENMTLLQLD